MWSQGRLHRLYFSRSSFYAFTGYLTCKSMAKWMVGSLFSFLSSLFLSVLSFLSVSVVPSVCT